MIRPVSQGRIRVLIVDDSPVGREFLTYVMGKDPALEIVGFARDGIEAVAQTISLRPHVITMDLHMPRMDGVEATREIMSTIPTPIVVVSNSLEVREVKETFQVMEAGALAVLRRPPGIGHPDHLMLVQELLRTVKLMSEIRLVRRSFNKSPVAPAGKVPPTQTLPGQSQPRSIIVGIGASTGGPPVLQKILSLLPQSFSYPILIVQHITSGFVSGFAKWLSGAAGVPVRLAVHGEDPLPGRVYIAPDKYHLGIGSDQKILLSDLPSENGLRPSVGFLFRSMARHCGKGGIGVLLTGMGSDGAAELREMKDAGATTIVQDKESSVVFGMPGKALEQDAAVHVLSPEEIGRFLSSLH